jgi:hypothetical protein
MVVMAAVSVVLPWSIWPMVPTLTWGLSLLKVSFDMLSVFKVVFYKYVPGIVATI